MPTCPECHFQKGLYSPLKKENENVWICKIAAHKFTRDKEGYFHSIK